MLQHYVFIQAMTMMFEVQDLAVASPATVSRCGMVYLEPSILGLSPFVTCWLQQLPEVISPYTEHLEKLFGAFLDSSIKYVKQNTKEFAPTVDGNLTFSLLRLLECFFTPFMPKEGKPALPEDSLKQIEKLIEPWFSFSLVWSIGATCDGDGRKKFDLFVREKMKDFGKNCNINMWIYVHMYVRKYFLYTTLLVKGIFDYV